MLQVNTYRFGWESTLWPRPSISEPLKEIPYELVIQGTASNPVTANLLIDADTFENAQMVRVLGKETPQPILTKLTEERFIKTGHRGNEPEGDIFMRKERLWFHQTLK